MKLFPISYLLLVALLVFSSCGEDSEPDILTSLQILDEPYGSHLKQNMDVYLPAGRSSEQTSLLVYIHGGGWIDGDKSEFLQIKSLVEKEFPGFAFVSLNYRLFDFVTETNGISEQEQDIVSAFHYIESQLADWNISGEMVISGASAGGHLALLHAFKNNFSDLKAAVAFFPPTDLAALYGGNNLTNLGLEALLRGTPDSAPTSYHDSSPVNFVDAQDVPTIFFHGNMDPVVPISQSLLLEDVLQAKNVRHQFTVVPGQGHGFTEQTYAALLREAKQFVGEF
ncbi:prolyl oligopeptidase family serine peptidase [Algoriphagus terrigena]|uniref:prolyl oligopeptidase family serine peptidase n=1 Tax=Algoriphagus terrigena TaxID=344884 RepID=UPI000420411F|nr:prolyl oligopeptidase family serine peptidase [Algoriphagus terrigena]